MTENEIKVLVVDDSVATRLFLAEVLDSDPQIHVVGTVGNGHAVLDFLQQNKLDVVLVNIHTPEGVGDFETVRRIMETQPLPIVVCGATGDDGVFRSLEAGAVACVETPLGSQRADFEMALARLLDTVKLMSEVKVVRRWKRSPATRAASLFLPPKPLTSRASVKLIGIGASTGGPPVLQTIFAGLPKDFSLPILVVQHIARGFLPGMAEWLTQTTGRQVRIASCGILPLPGVIYLAPDDCHMGVDARGHIALVRQIEQNGLCPAVAFLFRSLAEVHGPNAIGVLLTGMGRDGATELGLMKEKGATTIAQDRASSVVHGMPGAAIALGAATQVLPANMIADALAMLANTNKDISRS